jgi:hypothetical protein
MDRIASAEPLSSRSRRFFNATPLAKTSLGIVLPLGLLNETADKKGDEGGEERERQKWAASDDDPPLCRSTGVCSFFMAYTYMSDARILNITAAWR